LVKVSKIVTFPKAMAKMEYNSLDILFINYKLVKHA
jgi:hypothetical protein